MDEKMRKHAFRVVYDFVESHQHPQDTHEYFDGVLHDIQKMRSDNPGNELLDCLMIGVYEYLMREAKKEAERT